MTTYSVVEGDTSAFNGGQGKRLDAFGPHSANLILVAKRLDPVCWMDPTQEVPLAVAQLGVNSFGATTGLGSEHGGGMHAAFRSGSVRFINENLFDEFLLQLLEGTSETVP